MPDNPNFLTVYKTESDLRMRIHLLTLHHVCNEGKKYTEISGIVKYERHTISNWVKHCEAGGIEGLKDRPRRGPRQRQSPEKTPEFKDKIVKKTGIVNQIGCPCTFRIQTVLKTITADMHSARIVMCFFRFLKKDRFPAQPLYMCSEIQVFPPSHPCTGFAGGMLAGGDVYAATSPFIRTTIFH